MDFFERISNPAELKKIPIQNLNLVAEELRTKIIDTVAQNGGHLASSLGAVELAIALHYCLDTPKDKIIWDVGHQAYAHKLLTGRFKDFHTLRQFKGISGFPNKFESEFDPFTTGHSSTAVSLALGLACARDLKVTTEKIVAVIGDGSLSGGLCFEALNNAGHLKKDLIVVLNSNEMAISRVVGALSSYINKIISKPIYNRLRNEFDSFLSRLPKVGHIARELDRRFEESVKNLLIPGILFEELGFRYFGPLDGHNLELVIPTLKNVLNLKGPIMFHVITQKGKGYKPAEANPEKFHGTAPFEVETGEVKTKTGEALKSYTQVFGETLQELARDNKNIVAITAAMPDGTGLNDFAKAFPERFFDVGIAEEHAVCFASGLSAQGFKPVIAVYSTFLQRSYDQIMQDLALQKADCLLAIDRAGIVGEDGATHQGIFDIAYLKDVPGMVVMAPKDEVEFKLMLKFGIEHKGPIAVRYPRGKISKDLSSSNTAISLGRAEVLQSGKDALIIALGTMVEKALDVSRILSSEHSLRIGVVNARFVKPLDEELFKDLISRYSQIFIVEEAVQTGSFGAYFLEEMHGVIQNSKTKIHLLGIPDEFVEHGKRDLLLQRLGLDVESLVNFVISKIKTNA